MAIVARDGDCELGETSGTDEPGVKLANVLSARQPAGERRAEHRARGNVARARRTSRALASSSTRLGARADAAEGGGRAAQARRARRTVEAGQAPRLGNADFAREAAATVVRRASHNAAGCARPLARAARGEGRRRADGAATRATGQRERPAGVVCGRARRASLALELERASPLRSARSGGPRTLLDGERRRRRVFGDCARQPRRAAAPRRRALRRQRSGRQRRSTSAAGGGGGVGDSGSCGAGSWPSGADPVVVVDRLAVGSMRAATARAGPSARTRPTRHGPSSSTCPRTASIPPGTASRIVAWGRLLEGGSARSFGAARARNWHARARRSPPRDASSPARRPPR